MGSYTFFNNGGRFQQRKIEKLVVMIVVFEGRGEVPMAVI